MSPGAAALFCVIRTLDCEALCPRFAQSFGENVHLANVRFSARDVPCLN